jgi:hypothetical protein
VSKETINVNGKRLNKLEEIVRLLQKLNEDHYSKEELETGGYPIELVLQANGGGSIRLPEFPCRSYVFDNTELLYNFLTANRRTQLQMFGNQKENS